MANTTFTNVLTGANVVVDTTTVSLITVGTNSASSYVHTSATGGVNVLGTQAVVSAQIATAGSLTATDHYSPQFNEYYTLA